MKFHFCFNFFEDSIEFFFQGDITFFAAPDDDVLYIHFTTVFDNVIMEELLEEVAEGKCSSMESFVSFNSHARTTFGRILLFALQICHIMVLTEPASNFDASYL